MEDFVDFLQLRDEDMRPIREAAKLSERPSMTCGTIRRTPHMTDHEFGDVVLIPFPFTDQTTAKKRYAVIVSSTTNIAAVPISCSWP
ncbi:MAG TPA: hypothetical protein VJZ49_00030 [Syntrophales bacterium]|nr:hypothetical protein [Syntrophales bacterium]